MCQHQGPYTTYSGGSRLQDELIAILLEIFPFSLILAAATHCWNCRLERKRWRNRWTGFDGEASSPAIRLRRLRVQGSQFTATAFTSVLTVVIEIIARVERQP
jgi:hypothetical protein